MNLPIYTAIAAGALLILQQALMLTVGMYRTRVQVGVGTGEDKHLERLIRRHGNLAENSAIFLVALGLLEMFTGSTIIVMSLAIAFVLGRLFHAVGFSSLTGSHLEDGSRAFLAARVTGAGLTALTGLGLGAYLLFGGVVG